MKIVCDSWEDSVAAQKALEERGFQLINPKQSLQMATFVMVFPPCWCHVVTAPELEKREQYGGCPIHDLHDKPVICSDSGTTSGKDYVSLESALTFIGLIEYMQNNNPPETS